MAFSETIFWVCIYTLEGVIIICCNILGLVIFTKKARLSRPCLLLANQCLADCFVGVSAACDSAILHFSHQGMIPYSTARDDKDDIVCHNVFTTISVFLFSFTVKTSFISLALIALERAYAVFRPFKHRVLRKKKYFYAVMIAWGISLAESSLYLVEGCRAKNDIMTNIIYILSFIILLCCILAIIISYLSIYIKMHCFPTFENNPHNQREVKLCMTVFYASVASVVTMAPFSFVKYFVTINCPGNKNCLPGYIQYLGLASVYSNSFINFFIYAWKFPDFVKTAKSLFGFRNGVHNHVRAARDEGPNQGRIEQ